MSEPSAQSAGAEVTIAAATWRRLLVVTERLAGSSDLDAVLGLVIDSLRDCLGAERASVFQYDAESHELFATRAHGVDRSLRFGAELGLAGEAVRTKAIVNVPDCYADERFNREIDRQTGYVTRNMLTIPLVGFDGGLEGVAQVLNRAGGAFGEREELIARALASQAAVAIRRARLIESERRKNKIEADLRVAREMQEATLPPVLPMLEGYRVSAVNRQAEETGGDTFDVVKLGGEGAGRLMVLMADATGHGIGPAISATQVQAMVRMAARAGTGLARAVAEVNSLMSETLPAGLFVTAFVGEVDGAAHEVRYVSAGQAPILVVRAGGGVEQHGATMMPLGLESAGPEPEVKRVAMGPGDALVLLSDGYYEYRNAAREQFGIERVVRAVKAGIGEGPRGALRELEAALERHGGGAGAEDDQTAVIVQREA